MAAALSPGGLPATAPMCYKPSMRKWMRDKLKGRKKSQEEAGARPAPLQPAYFEPEAGSEDTAEARATKPTAEISDAPDLRQRSEADLDSASESATPAQTGTGSQAASAVGRPRRRRGRGGRGRRRPTSVASAAPKSPTAEPQTAAADATGIYSGADSHCFASPQQGNRRTCHWTARFRQEFMVQAEQHQSALQRPGSLSPVR